MFSGRSKSNYKYKRRSSASEYIHNNSKVVKYLKYFMQGRNSALFSDRISHHEQRTHQYSYKTSFYEKNNSRINSKKIRSSLKHFIVFILVLLNHKFILWTDKCKHSRRISSFVKITVFLIVILDVLILETNGEWLFYFLVYVFK